MHAAGHAHDEMMMVGYSYKLCTFVIERMHVGMYIGQHCMKKANKFIKTE